MDYKVPYEDRAEAERMATQLMKNGFEVTVEQVGGGWLVTATPLRKPSRGSAWNEKLARAIGIVKEAALDEDRAARQYREFAAVLRNGGFVASAGILGEIMRDEARHHRKLEELLAKMREIQRGGA